MVKIYLNQHNTFGKIIVLSILTCFIAEFIFSVLLDMGIPLIRGITIPFLDMNFGVIVLLLQMGIVENLSFFGNYTFINDTLKRNKLFDVEDGKVIIYYK